MQIASRQCLWKDTASMTGTVVAVEAAEGSMTVSIAAGSLAPGSKSVTIDWGDGQISEYAKITNASHAYARPGEYTVAISNDLSSFGYGSHTTSMPVRNMLRELVHIGSKVTKIEGYGFNNCQRMRGVVNLPNVTYIGSYAFGSTLGITDYILPSMTTLRQDSFYCHSSPKQIHADNVKKIDPQFWDYYGWELYDLYLRGSTCAEIRAMSGFPFLANRIDEVVRFHGADGIILKDGTIIAN